MTRPTRTQNGDIDVVPWNSRHFIGNAGRLRGTVADPLVLLPVVGVAASPSVGVTAGLEPKVLVGGNEARVVLVHVLPPASGRVHVGLGLARPVDDNLKTGTIVKASVPRGRGRGPGQDTGGAERGTN